MTKFLQSIKEYLQLNKSQLRIVGFAFLAGVLWLIALRFVTLQSDAVHYHANFGIFVDGQRLPLDSPLYYEEVQACGGDEVFNPKIRVHMHDQVSHVLHVHDAGATWGHFFANIGMTHGDSVFRIDNKVYTDSEATPITYILNGRTVGSTANTTIRSEDTLLVSIGTDDPLALQEQYAAIAKDAGEYNSKYDPAGCSGGKDFTFFERLKKSVGVF
jgi:hypothetical protein